MRLLADLHDPEHREIHLHYPHRQFLGLRVRVVVDALLASFAASEVLHWRPAGWASTRAQIQTHVRERQEP